MHRCITEYLNRSLVKLGTCVFVLWVLTLKRMCLTFSKIVHVWLSVLTASLAFMPIIVTNLNFNILRARRIKECYTKKQTSCELNPFTKAYIFQVLGP